MRRAIVMVMAAVLALAMATPASASGAEHTEASWLQATCAVEGVEPAFTDGSMHVRGEVHHDVIYMDGGEGYQAVGENTIVFDYDVSLTTLNGRGGGSFEVELYGLPAPAFVGHFNGSIEAGLLTARANGKGGGAFAGDLLSASIRQIEPFAWMCDGGTVYKAVAVTATIVDK